MILSVSKSFSPFKVGIYCPLQLIYFKKFDHFSSNLSVVGRDNTYSRYLIPINLIEDLHNMSLSKLNFNSPFY